LVPVPFQVQWFSFSSPGSVPFAGSVVFVVREGLTSQAYGGAVGSRGGVAENGQRLVVLLRRLEFKIGQWLVWVTDYENPSLLASSSFSFAL